MKNTRISDTLIYQEYSSDARMYEALDIYLKNNYKIVRHVYLCPVVSLGKEEYILSYLHIEDPKENIEEQIMALCPRYEIWEPDYSDTILNVLAGFRRNYGYTSKYQENKDLFQRKYKSCIVMLLDGLGLNILKGNLPEDSFLRKHYRYSEHAIYPSTTAASTTSTVCGLTPLESGWTGWSNWIREMNREIVLFNGMNYYTEESTGRTGYQLLPYKPFFQDMDIEGYVINPDFSKEEKDINDVLKESLKKLSTGKPQIQYVYYTDPDYLMHENGPFADVVRDELFSMDRKLSAYAEKLPEDTLLVISADHGHTAVQELSLYACKPLMDCLRTKPSNDSRSVVFRLKEGKEALFVELFTALYGDVYRLMKTEDAIEKGYFGHPSDQRHERISDFLGDYVAVATSSWYFNFFGERDFVFKSHHAGITRDEMEVPVIVFEK